MVTGLLLLLVILVGELLDLLSIESRLFEWLPSSAVRESHCCNLLHILLSHGASSFQSCQSCCSLIDGDIGPQSFYVKLRTNRGNESHDIVRDDYFGE